VSGDLHSAWSSLYARSLASAGLGRVVLSPGSRSTPLALAFAREPGIELEVVVDERAAGFVALGMARAEGRPAAVLCTSGSAAAHYHPAIVEAERAGVPLLVITADRPWELVHAQASQTIDQTRMYGAHVRASLELGLPEPSALPAVPRLAAQAVAATLHPVPGPVHVNARFRKPLEPQPGGSEPWRPVYEALLERGAPRVHLPAPRADEACAQALAELARAARRGVVLAGPSWAAAGEGALAAQARLERALSAFARATGFLVVAEISSGLVTHGGPSIGPASLLLGSAEFRAALATDLVVELGMPLVAPGHATLVAEHPWARRVLLAPWGLPDPLCGARDVFIGDAASLLERAAELCAAPSTDAGWSAPLRSGAERVDAAVAELLSEQGALELELSRALFGRLPSGAALMLGNSLVVRDADACGAGLRCGVTVLHQRGAAGIDGLVAGALGLRRVVSPEHPVVLLVGDVSAAHDLASIALLAEVRAPLVIVVVDNGGGRIFGELPVAKLAGLEPELERLFYTPQPHAPLRALAEAAGLDYASVSSSPALGSALDRALAREGASIVHAACDHGASARARRSLAVRVDAIFEETAHAR